MTPRSRSKLLSPWGEIAPLASFVALTLVFTYPLASRFTSAIPGDGFDGWQNYWNLWWTKIALLDQHSSPFFTNLLYHPTGVGLLFHTLNFFNGLLTLPIQIVWGLIPAYNSVVIFSFVIGGYGAYLLARWCMRERRDRAPAFAAGVIFTFSPFHMAHLLGHMQVISLQWIPFFALYLLRTVAPRRSRNPRLTDVLKAGFFLTLVGLCDWYYVLYCLLLTALVLAWVAWRTVLSRFRGGADRDRPGPSSQPTSQIRPVSLAKAIVAAGGACLLFGLILSPLLIPMIREASQLQFMVPDPQQSRTLSADLAAFVTPQEFHPLWGEWARTRAAVFAATVSEHQIFVGFSTLFLLGLALVVRRRRGALAPWPWIAIAFFVLSLGPVLHVNGSTALLPGGKELHLPYAWIARAIPFMEISRSVSRFDVMIMLAVGVMAAAGLATFPHRRQIARWALIAVILFEFLPAPYPMSPPDTPDWYRSLAQDSRSGAVLNLPMEWDRPGYLLYQTVHKKPLTVAYISRDDPRTLTARAPVLQQLRHLGDDIINIDLPTQGMQVLHDLDVRWVVLDRYKMPGEPARSYNERIAAELFVGTEPVYVDERLTVYEVVDTPISPTAYPILGVDWGPFDRRTGTRSFSGQANVEVRSTSGGTAELLVTLVETSARFEGQTADLLVLRLELEAGANQVVLRAAEPGGTIVVKSLELRMNVDQG